MIFNICKDFIKITLIYMISGAKKQNTFFS